MREEKLKLVPDNFDHYNWLILYRIRRAARSGKRLKLIGSRTPEQLIVALLLGENIPQKAIESYSRMMKAAKKAYHDSYSCGTYGYPLNGDTFEGGVHHEFGTFTSERATWGQPDASGMILDYKGMLINDMDVYRAEHGLPPVKWKGAK